LFTCGTCGSGEEDLASFRGFQFLFGKYSECQNYSTNFKEANPSYIHAKISFLGIIVSGKNIIEEILTRNVYELP
jgi:hypothetical protein